MGWYGLQQAILTRDVDELVEELSPRRNPLDPSSALLVAIEEMTPAQRLETLRWAEGWWLRQSENDVLRGRGDHRWVAVNLVAQVCKAHLTYQGSAGYPNVESGAGED